MSWDETPTFLKKKENIIKNKLKKYSYFLFVCCFFSSQFHSIFQLQHFDNLFGKDKHKLLQHAQGMEAFGITG